MHLPDKSRLDAQFRRTLLGFVAAVALLTTSAATGRAGSIFLTGHDPDFHSVLGGNALGARHINQAAIGYILDPLFNP